MRGLVGKLLPGLLALLFAAGLGLSMLGEPAAEVPGSAASNAGDGRRALLLVLEALGVRVEAWRGSPGRLPRDGALLWMARAPVSVDRGDDEAAQPEGGAGLDPRDPRHVGDFVREGGALLVPVSEGALEWLREAAELPGPAGADELVSRDGGTVVLGDGRRLRLAAGGAGERESPTGPGGDGAGGDGASGDGAQGEADPSGRPREEASGGEVLVAWEDGAPFAVAHEVGAGRVVLLADDAFLDNDALGLADHGLLAAHLVERLAPSGRVLLDEFALGRWLPTSRAELLASPGLREAALHGLLLLVLLGWLHGWVREFPRDPASPPLDPRRRVQARAALLVRAGALDALAEELRQGVLRRLATRGGVRLVGAAGPRPAAEVVEALRARHPRLRDDPGWASLAPGPVGGARDLERLGAELAALERTLLAESPRSG